MHYMTVAKIEDKLCEKIKETNAGGRFRFNKMSFFIIQLKLLPSKIWNIFSWFCFKICQDFIVTPFS